MLRHEILNVLLLRGGEGLIAERTTGKEARRRRNSESVEHLPKLVVNAVMFDQEAVFRQRARGKDGVSGEDDAVLLQGEPDEPVVVQGPVIENIEPQKPQTLREPAQHDVGDELHGGPTARHEGAKKALCLFLDILCVLVSSWRHWVYRNFFSLNEFVTTLTELNAIAAEANMGLSRILKNG